MNLQARKSYGAEEKWIFSKEELLHLPSIGRWHISLPLRDPIIGLYIVDGMRADEEMSGRRRASDFVSYSSCVPYLLTQKRF